MKSIAQLTQEQILKSPFILEALKDGLLNISAYARIIIPDLEKLYGDKVKLTAVVMAIQRMDLGGISHEGKKLKALFRKVKDIQMRGQLTEYTLRQSKTLHKQVSKLYAKIGNRHDVMCTYTQGVFEATIILNNSEAHLFESLFCTEEIIESTKKLSAFTLLLPPENIQLSGVYYFIMKQLAWYSINIVEVVSTSNEFTIVVHEKDSLKCFEVLRKIGT